MEGGFALDLSLQSTHCFQNKRGICPGISRISPGFPCSPGWGREQPPALRTAALLLVCILTQPEDSGKEMLTCCLSLRGTCEAKWNEIFSQLFNLLRRKEFYEDNNMLSLIRETCSVLMVSGDINFEEFFFFFFSPTQ